MMVDFVSQWSLKIAGVQMSDTCNKLQMAEHEMK